MKKIIFIIIFFILSIIGFYQIWPYFINIDIQKIPASQIIFDDKNIEIWEIISQNKYRHIEKELDYFPDFLKKAIINIEDKRFYNHHWIDYIWILRAIKNNIFNDIVQWASTIDNQVIRHNLWINDDRSMKRKIKEFIYSLALNKKYSKDEILEFYLNNTNLWYMNFWFESASRYYYGKSVINLTQAEIIWIITIIKNPNKYNPLNNLTDFNKRFKLITNTLYKNWIINFLEQKEILNEKFVFIWQQKQKLPYIVDFVKNKNIFETTIDYYLTQKIDELAKSSIRNLKWKNVWDYSVIIVDRTDMWLKVMIWWNDYYNDNWQVNWSLALRQPWSALKPFIYLLAFRDKWYTQSTTILDLPISYKNSEWNSYEPKNYSLDFKWEVSCASALSQSINVPAVKLLNEIWIDNFMNFLRNLKISSINKNSDYYGLSLALWSAEVSLYELLQAYSIFSNNWEYCDIRIDKNSIKKCKNIIDKKYIDMISDILTNRYFKLWGFPINSNLDFEDRFVFVKTWTSRNFKDNLAIWFTKNYMIWVWVWNKDGSEMMWVSGATWAWDIFRKIVYFLEKESINSQAVVLKKEDKKYLYITSPLYWNEFKIDNFIPIEKQNIKLSFKTNIDYDEKIWYLNDKKMNWDFLNIMNLKIKNVLKIILYKWWQIVWNDEVKIEKQED